MIMVSQDKKDIINFDNVKAISVQNNMLIAVGQFLITEEENGGYILGKYATEERAKEVLQEIKKVYQLGRLFECIKSVEEQEKMASDYAKDKESPFVYQMPAE